MKKEVCDPGETAQGVRCDTILEGKPFMTEFGIVGYSTVVLVQAEDRRILFDCGQRGCALQLKEGLAKQGLTCSDITDVVISHMHFDHVGNLPLFPNALVHISECEWQSVWNEPDEWHCLQTAEYIRQHCSMHFVGEGDQLAEGVEVLELPGHTPGLIGLRIGDRILCSDAIKNRYEMWEDMPLMAADVEKSRKTQARIRREAKIIDPGHDSVLRVDVPTHHSDVSFRLKFADGVYREFTYRRE